MWCYQLMRCSRSFRMPALNCFLTVIQIRYKWDKMKKCKKFIVILFINKPKRIVNIMFMVYINSNATDGVQYKRVAHYYYQKFSVLCWTVKEATEKKERTKKMKCLLVQRHKLYHFWMGTLFFSRSRTRLMWSGTYL